MHPIVVLGYHRLEDGDNPVATSPRLFAAHLQWLAGCGYRHLRLTEFEAALAGTPVSPKRFLITFDDGYESVFHHGLPILREFGFSAVNFLITGMVGSPGYLSWEQVARMEQSGVFQTQSHSHAHTNWATVADMAADLATSRAELVNHLGMGPEAIRHLAWPWGRCERDWPAAARLAGFPYQHLVRPLAISRATVPWAIPRICCDGYSLTRFTLTVGLLSSSFGNQAVQRVWEALRGRRYAV